MPASTTLPAASTPQNGLSKARRLFQLTDGVRPEFPLDEEIVARLADYPGELPRSSRHWLDLLYPDRRD